MRAWTLVAGLLLLLAGCTSGGGDGEGDGDDDPVMGDPTVYPWGLEDCRMVVAILPADKISVEQHVPEGFRSLSIEEIIDTGTNVVGEANLGIEVFTCASGAGLDGPVEGMHYGSYFTAVEPPEELRQNVSLHFVKWETMVPDEARRLVLQGHGMPAVEGQGSFRLHQGTGTTWFYQADMTLDGADFSFAGTTNQAAGADITFVEFQQTDGGLVQWHATVDLSQVGVGPVSVTLPGTGLAAEILDAPIVQGVAYGGMTSFTESSITVPAA